MKVLFLGSHFSPLIPFIKETDDVCVTDMKVSPVFAGEFDFLISYGYRHILKKDILDLFPDRAINLHISFLPWNRGADPNLWSFIRNTPKGVTIHYMDEGLDTGDIICQREVEFDLEIDTLGTSYNKLQLAIQQLFKEEWSLIRDGSCNRRKQEEKGSYQHSRDKEALKSLYSGKGFNTLIRDLYI